MFAYLQGYAGGNDLEKKVKKMKKFINHTGGLPKIINDSS